MSGGVGDLLPHLLVLGEPHSDPAEALCHRQTWGHLQEVSPRQDWRTNCARLSVILFFYMPRIFFFNFKTCHAWLKKVKVKKGPYRSQQSHLWHRGRKWAFDTAALLFWHSGVIKFPRCENPDYGSLQTSWVTEEKCHCLYLDLSFPNFTTGNKSLKCS